MGGGGAERERLRRRGRGGGGGGRQGGVGPRGWRGGWGAVGVGGGRGGGWGRLEWGGEGFGGGEGGGGGGGASLEAVVWTGLGGGGGGGRVSGGGRGRGWAGALGGRGRGGLRPAAAWVQTIGRGDVFWGVRREGGGAGGGEVRKLCVRGSGGNWGRGFFSGSGRGDSGPGGAVALPDRLDLTDVRSRGVLGAGHARRKDEDRSYCASQEMPSHVVPSHLMLTFTDRTARRIACLDIDQVGPNARDPLAGRRSAAMWWTP